MIKIGRQPSTGRRIFFGFVALAVFFAVASLLLPLVEEQVLNGQAGAPLTAAEAEAVPAPTVAPTPAAVPIPALPPEAVLSTTAVAVPSIAPPSEGAPSVETVRVVGNSDSKRYHLPGMKYYEQVAAYHRVAFSSEDEAIKAGYHKAPR